MEENNLFLISCFMWKDMSKYKKIIEYFSLTDIIWKHAELVLISEDQFYITVVIIVCQHISQIWHNDKNII